MPNKIVFSSAVATSITVLTLSCGCQPPSSPAANQISSATAETKTDESGDQQASEKDPQAQAAVPIDVVKISEVDFAGLQAQIQQFSGKLVVLDVWSTACPPCMREYPNLVALSQKWPDRVVCMSLNCDYIGIKSKPVASYLPKVKQFLEKEKSTSVVNLISNEADSDIFEKLEISSIPGILVYGTDGKLHKKFLEGNSGDDGLTYQGDVIPTVEALLK